MIDSVSSLLSVMSALGAGPAAAGPGEADPAFLELLQSLTGAGTGGATAGSLVSALGAAGLAGLSGIGPVGAEPAGGEETGGDRTEALAQPARSDRETTALTMEMLMSLLAAATSPLQPWKINPEAAKDEGEPSASGPLQDTRVARVADVAEVASPLPLAPGQGLLPAGAEATGLRVTVGPRLDARPLGGETEVAPGQMANSRPGEPALGSAWYDPSAAPPTTTAAEAMTAPRTDARIGAASAAAEDAASPIVKMEAAGSSADHHQGDSSRVAAADNQNGAVLTWTGPLAEGSAASHTPAVPAGREADLAGARTPLEAGGADLGAQAATPEAGAEPSLPADPAGREAAGGASPVRTRGREVPSAMGWVEQPPSSVELSSTQHTAHLAHRLEEGATSDGRPIAPGSPPEGGRDPASGSGEAGNRVDAAIATRPPPGGMEAAPAAEAAPANVDGTSSALLRASVIEQIARRAHLAVRGRGGLSIQLEPRDLGKVQVHVTMGNDGLRVGVTAEAENTRQMLQASLPQLRAAFESQGIVVERFDMGFGGNLVGFGTPEGSPQQRQGPAGSPAGGTFLSADESAVGTIEAGEARSRESLVDYRI